MFIHGGHQDYCAVLSLSLEDPSSMWKYYLCIRVLRTQRAISAAKHQLGAEG